ncbi:MAG: NYN domain-containing protein [Chloroflexi bacterium]|nr:NYN domain-containing protein [Chloroflexota bacterium]
MTDRVMIFIDGSNLYHSLKNIFGRTDLDMGKFARKLLGRRYLTRIYYYNAKVGQREEPERYRSQQEFFRSLKNIPYLELRLGRLVYNNWPSSPPYEKGIDIQLATDMITHAFKNTYDVAILVAGDNDYVGAIQAVKDYGKHFEVALFGRQGTSRELRQVADRVIQVNSRTLHDCWKSSQARQQQPHPEPAHGVQAQA